MTELSDDGMDRLRSIIAEPDLSESRYRLISKIDSGGMGTVWLAEDTLLRRNIALKVLTSQVSADALAERLRQEAHVLAQMEHPGIVPVHDVGVLRDGSVYFAMKFVDGVTLEVFARTARNRHTLLTIFTKLCEAVAFAHSRGVIHRDIKPSNIMIGKFGEVLLMDWGVAKLHDEYKVTQTLADKNEIDPRVYTKNRTTEGSVIGTLEYMSPEQARGEQQQVSAQSDIYALGGILYYLFSLTPPIRGNGIADIRERVMQSRREKLQSDIPVDRRLIAIIDKAMAPSPQNRYPNAISMSNDVAKYVQDEPVEAYPENLFEKVGRWVGRNKVIVTLVIVYMIVRLLVFISLKV